MSTSTETINSRTIGGTLIFCDWMVDKGYGSTSQVGPWKIALNKVFSAVEGESFESLDWSALDLDEYLERFQRLAGANYKSESIVAYGRRVRNALGAHQHYLETGRAPVSKPVVRREKPASKPETSASVTPIDAKKQHALANPAEMVTFPYPLDDGRMISMTIPPRLKASDVDRITAFIRTLQDNSPERKQLPRPGQEEVA